MIELLIKLQYKSETCLKLLCPLTETGRSMFGLAAFIFFLGTLGVAGTPSGKEGEMPGFVVLVVLALFQLGLGISATIVLAPVGLALL